MDRPIERPYDFLLAAELNPNSIVAVKLLESLSIGDDLKDFDRRDAEIRLYGQDISDQGLPMAFNATSEKYHVVREDYRVKEGLTYDLEIILPETEHDTIKATCRIPFSTDILAAEINNHQRDVVNDSMSHHQFDVSLRLSEPEIRPAYYRLAMYRQKSIKTLYENGNVLTDHLEDEYLLSAAEILDDRAAYQSFTHKEGLFIDESRLTSNILRLQLRTIQPVKDGSSIALQDGVEVIERFRFELETLNEPLYQYENWLHQVTQSQGYIQVREVNNITNAAGVFGASSRSQIYPRIR